MAFVIFTAISWRNSIALRRYILDQAHLRDIISMIGEILFESIIFLVLLVDGQGNNQEEGDNGGEDSHPRAEVEWTRVGDGRAGGKVGNQGGESPSTGICTNFPLAKLALSRRILTKAAAVP